MRVLFDQATPVPIRRFLTGHAVRTAAQQHWDTLKNGDLLSAAEEAGFEVFLTVAAGRRWTPTTAQEAFTSSSPGKQYDAQY